MRFMMLVKGSEGQGQPPQSLFEAIGQLGVEETKAGRMIESGGLYSSAAGGARVRLAGGKLTVIDGPFTEAKEVVGGYAVFELPSREAAVESARAFMELHRKHWPTWEGETEVRQVAEVADFASAGTPR
jgi:hypothetical protein